MGLSKTYRPADHENSIYRQWEESGAFGCNPDGTGKPFVVALPPPNANADLHIGYALDSQLKDILARWRRLAGQPVLLIPGADHAGFETWAVYEKHLSARGKSRFDFDREELYRQVYDFVMENMANMKNQIRRLGISCDWQKFTFTLDQKIVSRSYQTFRQMWQKDLIYRGKRLVNYCTEHGTGFADIEVSHKETNGQLYFIKYPIKDEAGQHITIATTRPETLLGDVAVAVHPDDQRYARWHGRTLRLPLADRNIPLICSDQVATDFGTGALKITPAHDFADFDIAQKAGLEAIEIIDKKGLITDQAPTAYRGLTVTAARQAVVEALETGGYLEKTEDHKHNVGRCYKCGSVLEPLLSDQWFVRMQPLAQKAIEGLRAGKIKFYPDRKRHETIEYLGQLQDWNISRQIAWGIPIPVFQNEQDEDDWIFDERVDQKILEIDGRRYRRDPDVFDTWWSSGQWPFAVVDWSHESPFYPHSLMETGTEILRPWVSRMILLSLFVTGKMPFENVYLHGMVVDEAGVKMSKSKGNVVDPMKVIDRHGADALRISLCSRAVPGQPQKFTAENEKIIHARNFCNKLWNIGRFAQSVGGENRDGEPGTSQVALVSAADHWIWERFSKAKKRVDQSLSSYRFPQAWDAIAGFVWDDLADWYLETCKLSLNRPFLDRLFVDTLRLAHPFAPFLTEALYQELSGSGSQPLIIDNIWSEDAIKQLKAEKPAAARFDHVRNLIIKIRQLLPPDLRRQSRLLLRNQGLIDGGFDQICQRLAGLAEVALAPSGKTEGLLVGHHVGYEAWLTLDHEQLRQHLAKLTKEARSNQAAIDALKKRLENPAYLAKAPSNLVEESRRRLEELVEKTSVLEEGMARFKEIL